VDLTSMLIAKAQGKVDRWIKVDAAGQSVHLHDK
jgi:hypothetical protein